MAEIPVEKKSAFPWWLLLVGAALLGLLLWMFMSSDNDPDVVTASPLTSVNSAVSLDDAVVTDVTGDMSFYVRANDGERYFVVFDETQTPGTATEGKYDINTGNTLDIDGMIRDRGYALPSGVNATIPTSEQMFIYATSIDK